ncbi:MAG: membrane protein insertion efficiency factor YidD [Synechococcales cyanobacterium C42_A2020_086]|jgi:putative component of membrane protein insertase Oxa1/YidC/SpoIIIJ protein YidD|nr:membrane protein insertion efficiency factor YidD [Synechococcales cyanobacterium C42_A2020_086]
MAATLATRMALTAVGTYQTHLSPHKGFSCPYRLLHGGESCSEYVKQVLMNQDLMTAIKLAPQRFRDCKAAAQMLQQTLRSNAQGGCIVIPCCIPI